MAGKESLQLTTVHAAGKPVPRERRLHGVLTLLGLCGIVLSFVPFALNTVPVTDVLVDWEIWDWLAIAALPCIVLPVPVAVGYAIWLAKESVPGWMAIVAYSLSVVFAVAVLTSIATEVSFEADEIAGLLIFVAAFAGAAWVVVGKSGHLGNVRGLVAMQCVYAVMMAYFLSVFAGDYQLGAWLGLVTLLAYLAQVVLVVKPVASLLPFFVPLAAMIALVRWLLGF